MSASVEHGFDLTRVSTCAIPQRKPAAGPASDPLEQEADRAADQVMRMAQPELSGAGMRIQRKCAACEDEERAPIQTKGVASRTTGAPAMDTRTAASAAARSGTPMPAALRAYFEPRFRHDFSGVRIHTDTEAANAAKTVQARAYTLGHSIVFGAGEYSPATEAGRRLLAHELAHVVQQRGGAGGGTILQRDKAPPSELDKQVAKMALSDADKAAFAQMAVKGSVPMQPNAVPLTGTEAFDTPLLGEYFFCQRMQSSPVPPFDNFCNFPGTVSGVPLFEAFREKFIKPEYAKISAETLAKLAKAHRTPDEMKAMLATCDGGLGIWGKAKKANGGKEPTIKVGKTDSGGVTQGGTIVIDEASDRCTATQVLIQELSNMSRAKDFDKVSSDALAGDLAREDYIKGYEKLEYESGVQNVLTAFDACKSVWKCDKAEKEWARKAADFDDYYSKLLNPKHKEDYGKWWDDHYKKTFEAKHPKKK